LTTTLPRLLVLDPTGRPFAPATLVFSEDLRRIPEQLALLMRPEPVGGAEALVRANAERIKAEALLRLNQRLASGAQTTPIRTFLLELQQEVRRVVGSLRERAREIERMYTDKQQTLRGWQESSSQEPGMVGQLIGGVLGSGGRISFPQAVTLWNERERLALRRLAATTALEMLNQVADPISALLERLEATLDRARRLHDQARQQLAMLDRPRDRSSVWTWRADSSTIAAQLTNQVSAEDLVAELLGRLGADGSADQIEEHTQALADQEAERRLETLNITDLLEAEASAAPLDGVDPLVLVGRRLLEALVQQPTWRLRRAARARMETLQITPDGEPLYRMDGLGSAAYGRRAARIGFVQVELHVAVDDLRLMHEEVEAFEQALARRNFYVLEALAEAWETQAGASTKPVSPGVHEGPAAPADEAA
jgi:hypothetical protein